MVEWWLLGAAAGGLCFVLYVAGWMWLQRRPEALDTPSAAMARGANVPAAKVPNHCINVCLYFKTLPERENLIKLLDEALVSKHLQFRAVPVPVWLGLGLVWKEVPTRVADRLHDSTAATDAAVDERRDAIIRMDIEGHPHRLWEVHCIRNASGGRSLVLFRIEHCIGDGMSLARLFQSLITDEAGQPVLMKPLAHRPVDQPQSLGAHLGRVLRGLQAIYTMFLGAPDTPSPFCPWRGDTPVYCRDQVVVRIPRHPLQLVKGIKDKAGATVNDVVFACFAGAFRRYLLARGYLSPATLQLRALVPVAFPLPEGRLGNKWAFASVQMPMGDEEAAGRLSLTVQVWRALKESTLVPISLFLAVFISGLLPRVITRQTCTDLLARHSVILSNVPGPDRPVRFAGALLDEILMVYPNVIPQVGMLSYNGELFGNITVDPTVVVDPHCLADYYLEELRALAAAYDVA
jgi:hypothetical protein